MMEELKLALDHRFPSGALRGLRGSLFVQVKFGGVEDHPLPLEQYLPKSTKFCYNNLFKVNIKIFVHFFTLVT